METTTVIILAALSLTFLTLLGAGGLVWYFNLQRKKQSAKLTQKVTQATEALAASEKALRASQFNESQVRVELTRLQSDLTVTQGERDSLAENSERLRSDLAQTRTQLAASEGERASLRAALSEVDRYNYLQLKQAIAGMEQQKGKTAQFILQLEAIQEQRKQKFEQQLLEYEREMQAKRASLVVVEDELLLQSFGFYQPHYNLENSDAFKRKLDETQKLQAEMIRTGRAAAAFQAWTLNSDKKEGERMVKDYIRLILRSFNNECDVCVADVSFSNVAAMEKRIEKAFETLNQLGERMAIAIAREYLTLKLQELYLVYEYQVQKQKEKEEQKRIREQMREEARLLKEIDDLRLKVEKEEKHFVRAIEAVSEKIAAAQTEAEVSILTVEKEKLEQNLADAEKVKQDVLNREQNTRAGYVYVISNLGAFGENVYKIGVTRRLEPIERVYELGDASVPFDFDIHAMIFSEDAPALELALHKSFEKRRLNLVNSRREFFYVSLAEIEKVVRENFSKPVEFTHLANAEEFRKSLRLREALGN